MQRKDYKGGFVNAVCTLPFVLLLTYIVACKSYFFMKPIENRDMTRSQSFLWLSSASAMKSTESRKIRLLGYA
jgi:hypothetical protein